MDGIHTRLLVILIVANVPVYIFLAWCIFGSVREFLRNERTAARGASRWRRLWMSYGERAESQWASLKALFYLIACAWVVYMEYRAIVHFFFSEGG